MAPDSTVALRLAEASGRYGLTVGAAFGAGNSILLIDVISGPNSNPQISFYADYCRSPF
jgi:hypothetical protein